MVTDFVVCLRIEDHEESSMGPTMAAPPVFVYVMLIVAGEESMPGVPAPGVPVIVSVAL